MGEELVECVHAGLNQGKVGDRIRGAVHLSGGEVTVVWGQDALCKIGFGYAELAQV